MASILFYYEGNINSEPIKGNGSLCSNPDSGVFSGAVKFDEFPNIFHPAAVGVSLLSVSCTNGGKSTYGIPNVFELTNGQYQSKRTVAFSDNTGAPLGQIVIDGNFEEKNSGLFVANVQLSGSYTGPTNLIIPNGYDLPLNVVTPTRLEGSFNLDINTTSGGIVKTTHDHLFEFTNGTSQSLQDCKSEIFYDNISSWNDTEKTLYLPGLSIMRIQ